MIDQKEIHSQCLSEDPEERIKALKQLKDNFPSMPDKQQAWNNLHKLTNDDDSDVRSNAASAIGTVFLDVPDKQQAWNDLHKLTKDIDWWVRSKTTSAIGSAFTHVLDKQQAWNELIKLTDDIDWWVRSKAASEIGFAFTHVPDKKQAWNDLIKLINDEDSDVRSKAAFVLGSAFFDVPDKKQAWNDLHKLTNDKDRDVRFNAVLALGSAFSDIPDKKQAWNDLHRLTNDEYSSVRDQIAILIGSAFSQMPDKQQVWNDLIKLTNDEDSSVRYKVSSAIGSAFTHVPNKKQAWNDLHKLTNDKDRDVRFNAVLALGSAFSDIPDKKQAWNDLIKLTNDEDSDVRSKAFYALGSAFSQVPDKQQVWNDLIKVTNDKNSSVRYKAFCAFGSAFSRVPDKQQAWNGLHKLTNDEDWWARYNAASAIGSAFTHIPDKQQAWDDLIKLTNDKNTSVRHEAAFTLGSAFFDVPDKKQAWNDLYKLTNDKDRDVRNYANHSLGKASIFKASQSEKEKDYKKELEKAIEFFEKATQNSFFWSNPSRFCLPFYRSFYTIIFQKQDEAKKEMDKYLAEAKYAVLGSKNKELLFEAVENLANALKKVQNLENLDFETKKYELNFYRQYCDRAAELMRDTEKTAPFATGAMRKGLPILDRNLKRLIEEIQEKAKVACQVSQGTLTQEIACNVNREVQEWEIGSPEEMTQKIEYIAFVLTAKIPDCPQNKHLFEKIEKMKAERNIVKQYEQLASIIVSIPMTYMTVNISENENTNISIGSINQSHEVATNSIALFNEQTKPLIGIITALPKEYAAVKSIFGNIGEDVSFPGNGAGRTYCLVDINSLNGNSRLVLANASMGTNIAATRATLLLEHFPDLKYIIMVGIAGGVPNPKKVNDHVRLGDIVVSDEKGVVQYDNIKKMDKENFEYRHPPRPPSSKLLEIARSLESNEILGNRPWIKYIDLALSRMKISRPSEEKDKLYKFYSSSNKYRKIYHPEDPNRINGHPRVFFGPIGSANILQKDPNLRDKLRDDFGIKAIEMEASGIADATWNHEAGYLVVRGICDYCDSHKNDEWQQYAAIVAAAYTRALIESMP